MVGVVLYELVKDTHHTRQARSMKSLIPTSLTISLPLQLLTLATIQACGVDAPTDEATQTAVADALDVPVQLKDSAGVRIVTYMRTPTAPPAFRLSAEPRYRHGANPGDYAFQEVTVGRFQPDGTAVIYDRGNNEVVALGPDGARSEVLAGEGEGPGEVQYVSTMFALGQDSILVVDPNLGRMTLFAGDSVALTTNVRFTRFKVAGIVSSGELLLATSSDEFANYEEWLAGHFARLDIETGAIDTVASYDFRPPIPPGSEWDPIQASGEVTVANGHFVHARTDRSEATWRLLDGTVTQIVRWQAEPDFLTEELLEPIVAELGAGVRRLNPDMPDAAVARIVRTYMAPYEASIGRPLPLFSSLRADAEGRVWLSSYRVSRGLTRTDMPPYSVIGSNGEWLGVVEAPATFRLLDVAGGLVLGVELDEMDVVSVVVYELVGA